MSTCQGESEVATLYHYCNAEAFRAIASSKKLWLSSMRMSNDSKEGSLVAEVLSQMAEEDNVSEEHMSEIKLALDEKAALVEGLGICLSSQGDLLSQWRGYAADGAGFSIGFHSGGLKKAVNEAWDFHTRFVSLEKVAYMPKDHKKILRPLYEQLRQTLDHHGPAAGVDYLTDIKGLSTEGQTELRKHASKALDAMFKLKNSAFREEREYRIVELVFLPEDAFYRCSGNKIIPYTELDLSGDPSACIVDVRLGPKNPTPPKVVQDFLAFCGLAEVDVSISAATYR